MAEADHAECTHPDSRGAPGSVERMAQRAASVGLGTMEMDQGANYNSNYNCYDLGTWEHECSLNGKHPVDIPCPLSILLGVWRNQCEYIACWYLRQSRSLCKSRQLWHYVGIVLAPVARATDQTHELIEHPRGSRCLGIGRWPCSPKGHALHGGFFQHSPSWDYDETIHAFKIF